MTDTKNLQEIVEQGLEGKADATQVKELETKNAALTEQVEEMKQLLADLEAKNKAPAINTKGAETPVFDVKAANDVLRTALSTKNQAVDFADLSIKATVNTDDGGNDLAIDDELGTTIIERARENVAILQLIGSKTVSSVEYREMVLRAYPTTDVGSEQKGATAPGDIWALTEGATYVQVSMAVGKQYAKPQISREVITDPKINLFAHLQTLLAEELSRYWALQVLIGDRDANENNLRGILNSKRVSAVESVKDNATRNPEFYPVMLSGVANSIGDGDPTAANSAIDKIIDLTIELPSKYHGAAKFVMNRRTLGLYRKLKDLDGRPMMSFEEGGFTLIGYPVVVEDYMPDVADARTSLAFPVIFGDLSRAYALCHIDDHFLVDPYSADGAVTLKYTSRKGDIVQNNDAIVIFAAHNAFPA